MGGSSVILMDGHGRGHAVLVVVAVAGTAQARSGCGLVVWAIYVAPIVASLVVALMIDIVVLLVADLPVIIWWAVFLVVKP